MRPLNEFVDAELIPRVFEMADSVLPEFSFKRTGSGWVSGNTRRVNGGEGSHVGSVYLYPDRPYLIKDYSAGAIALTTYLQESPLHAVNSWIESVRYLAEKVGLTVPSRTLSGEERALLERAVTKARVLEAVNDLFVSCLSDKGNDVAATPRAALHRIYLEGRGYLKAPPIVRLPGANFNPAANVMEVGFCPAQSVIEARLVAQGFSKSELEEHFFSGQSGHETKRLHPKIGVSHQLSLPFRDPSGRIQGFAFRTIDKEFEKDSKYLYSSGSWRSQMLFNLRTIRGNKDLVVVEGLLDAMHARARGLDNVVALGGTSINSRQILAAVELGADKITLCLDNDTAGKNATSAALRVIKDVPGAPAIYIATLPAGIKDPDELIQKEGLGAFEKVVAAAVASPRYQVSSVGDQAAALKSQGQLFDKDRAGYLKELLEIGAAAHPGAETQAFETEFERVITTVLGLSRAQVDADVARLREEQRKASVHADTLRTLDRATELATVGDLRGAFDLIGKQSKQFNTDVPELSFEELLRAPTEAELKDHFRKLPDAVPSGYSIGDVENVPIPAGAITIVAGPTSHGKTAFQINLALNICEALPEKRVHFFSFEESGTAVLLKCFNTYADRHLSKNNRRTIETYFKTDSLEYVGRDEREGFLLAKKMFIEQFVEAQRINVIFKPYDSDELIAAIRFLNERSPTAAILIDYMQLLRLPEPRRKGLSRPEELKQICMDLKDCAVETGLPIILGAQFNRQVVNPDLVHATNISEAGDIERIANLILGFWNLNFRGLNSDHETKSALEVTILKGRDLGAGAKGHLPFDGNTGKINNIKSTADDGPFS